MRYNCNWLIITLVISILFSNSINVFAATTATTALPAPTLSYFPTALTSGNVTVTIYFPSSAVTKQYKLGSNGTWTTYSSPVVITSNTYVYARYQDSLGNWSPLGGYPINNIDKLPPSNPTYSASTTTPSNQNVTITIGFSTDSTTKQYKIGSTTTWNNYTTPLLITSNTTVYARAADSVNNWTPTVNYTITNIDRDAPVIPILTADTSVPTNDTVNVSISYSLDSIMKQYKVGLDGSWIDYSSSLVISSNTTVYAKGQDLAGNWSNEGSIAITNIDKVPPAYPTFSPSNTNITNQDVTVNINFSDDSAVKQYKVGNEGIWSDYYDPIVLVSNDIIYAKACDSVGNWTAESSYEVLNVDKLPPMKPTFEASTIGITNQDVSVAIIYTTDTVLQQYKVSPTGIWTDYIDPILVSSNDIIYAKACDSAGNWTTEESYSVENIDKTPPDSPVFKPSTITPTNDNLNLTMEFSLDSSIKQYKVGSTGTWLDYMGSLTLETNNVIYARAMDEAGNWSPEVFYAVDNIDKEPPVKPVISASTYDLTNQDVSLSISYSADSSIRYYMTSDSGGWVDYSGPITVESNSTIYAKACDNAGNWTEEATYTIINIDKAPPIVPVITASSALPTKMNVIVSINFSNDSVIKQYMLGSNGVWVDYTEAIILDKNDKIYSRASDSTGNWSAEAEYIVSNIDKLAPANPTFTASIVEPTNQSVTVTINFSNDSSTRQYRLGSSDIWFEYIAPITLSSNETIYSKASDDAGNWTLESNYSVVNIDTAAPDKPVITASTVKSTDVPVVITIGFSTDSVIKQYRIGITGIWVNYTSPITLNKNSMVYARASDAVGNWSSEASYSVTNIRKTVLGYTVKNSSTDVSSYNSIVANTTSLNEIATATYSVDGYGKLTGTAPSDQINYANSNGIRTKLMVSNNFDANIAKQLLESTANRLTLKNNIITLLKTYNYSGVDIDIENIPAADRNYFTTFMSEIYSALKPLGYGVSVAVQPKNYDSPSATWNYAYDYKALAAYTDFLMIMAYDEHYPGGTPGSVASIDWVTSIIDYALTVVPKEKILLGLAAYGYDWAGSTTKAYSINGCYNLANQYGATVIFDNITKSKYFTYTVNGVAHTVWFEDGDTIAYKLDLANSRDLKGVGIWRLGMENTNYWATIKSKFNK